MTAHTDHTGPADHGGRATQSHYGRLGLMTLFSFAAMYVLMYAMVDTLDNVLMNVNQVYMAGLMAAPMVLIELALMRGMYQDTRRNAVIGGAAVVAALACWFLIRQQGGVGDRQFLRSMIPHHAGAILMCGEATIRDAEIRTLCESIRAGQQDEIDQMKAILRRLPD